jgi:hypothetical protein
MSKIHVHLPLGFNGQVWLDDDGRLNVRSRVANPTPDVEPTEQVSDVERMLRRFERRDPAIREIYDALVALGWDPHARSFRGDANKNDRRNVRFRRDKISIFLDSVKVWTLTTVAEPARSIVKALPLATPHSQGTALYYDRRTQDATPANVIRDLKELTRLIDER